MRHQLKALSESVVLAGAQAGRRFFAHWVATAARPIQPEIVFLDFAGIETATASFLRESVFGFRDYCRRSATTLYPVLANLNDSIHEEVIFFIEEVKEAVWCCELSEAGNASNVCLLGRGRLDAGQQRALELLEEWGESSAPDLAKRTGDRVGITAWNNRLASLAEKGLIVENKQGKTKFFRTMWRK